MPDRRVVNIREEDLGKFDAFVKTLPGAEIADLHDDSFDEEDTRSLNVILGNLEGSVPLWHISNWCASRMPVPTEWEAAKAIMTRTQRHRISIHMRSIREYVSDLEAFRGFSPGELCALASANGHNLLIGHSKFLVGVFRRPESTT